MSHPPITGPSLQGKGNTNMTLCHTAGLTFHCTTIGLAVQYHVSVTLFFIILLYNLLSLISDSSLAQTPLSYISIEPVFSGLLCFSLQSTVLQQRWFGDSASSNALSMNLFAPMANPVNDGTSRQGKQEAMTVVHRRLCHVSATS